MCRLRGAVSWGIEVLQKKKFGRDKMAESSSPPEVQPIRSRHARTELWKLSRLRAIYILEQLGVVHEFLFQSTMSIDRRKAALFGAAAAVRLLLFTSFLGLPDLLTARVEISTPVTSFKRCERPMPN